MTPEERTEIRRLVTLWGADLVDAAESGMAVMKWIEGHPAAGFATGPLEATGIHLHAATNHLATFIAAIPEEPATPTGAWESPS